jgi:hypothetical protein
MELADPPTEPPTIDPPYYYDDAPMEPIPEPEVDASYPDDSEAATDAPTYEEPPVIVDVFPEYPEDDMAPALDEIPEEVLIDDMPMEETITYMEEIAPVADPSAPGGYRKRFRRRKVKRRFALKRASESDLRLRFIKNCRDRHPRCPVWAGIKAVRTSEGKIVRVDECRTNPFMTTMEGCPRSCGVCTPNLVEFKLRRRNARVLRRRRLAKKTV